MLKLAPASCLSACGEDRFSLLAKVPYEVEADIIRVLARDTITAAFA
jgi:hypothetical protein